jgi:hypothetical protein
MKLINGAEIPEKDVAFNPATYRFHSVSTGQDWTNLIYRADKLRLVPGFDVERENLRISADTGRGGNRGEEKLNESTASAFLHIVSTDPLGAPIDALDRTVTRVIDSKSAKLAAFAAFALLVIYLARKA